MSRTPPAQIASLYRYPVKGLSPEPLPNVALSVGQTLPADRRYAIENGPSGFDPGRPEVDGEGPFPDADAGRMAGGAAQPFRRCDRCPDHPPRWRDRRLMAIWRGSRAAPPSSGFSPRATPDRSRDRPRFSPARATVSRMSPGRSSPSSISAASRRSRTSSASRCIPCGSAPTSMSAAGRPGTSSTCARPDPCDRRNAA